MKLLLIILFAGIIAFLSGVQLEKMRHARQDIEQLLRSDQNEQRYATVLSLAVLEAVEAGQLDKAKCMLAQELSVYHHAFRDWEASVPEKQRLAPQIDTLSTKSATLKEELQKPSH